MSANSDTKFAEGHHLSDGRNCPVGGLEVSRAAEGMATEKEMKRAAKFLGLVVILNVVRYVVGEALELRVTSRLFRVMEAYPSVFNNQSTAADWATSFFYNFMMWLTATLVFALMALGLRRSAIARSLKSFGLMLLFFVSVSAIYMNHYAHSKWFYIWNSLDAVIAFAVVGITNGLLYPRIFNDEAKAEGM